MRKLARLVALPALVCLLVASLSPAEAGQKPAPGPALETSEADLAAALHCPPSLRGLARDPVLLVHGTAADGASSGSWNYGVALPYPRFATCFVELPDYALRDIHESSEFVV